MSDEIDVRTRALLAALDPERRDPGYWQRFQVWVVNAAAPELARRRRAAGATVSEVVFSWWRMLVPTALVTAVLAAALLLRERRVDDPVAYVDMDELLMEGVEAPEMPSFEVAAPDGGIELVNDIF